MYSRLVRRALLLLTLSACSAPGSAGPAVAVIPAASEAPRPNASSTAIATSPSDAKLPLPEGWWQEFKGPNGDREKGRVYRFEREMIIGARRRDEGWRFDDALPARWERGPGDHLVVTAGAEDSAKRVELAPHRDGWQVLDERGNVEGMLRRPIGDRAAGLDRLDVPTLRDLRAMCDTATDCCRRLGGTPTPHCKDKLETFDDCRRAIDETRVAFSAMPPESCQVPRRWARGD